MTRTMVRGLPLDVILMGLFLGTSQPVAAQSITEFPTPNEVGDITTGPDGNLWFIDGSNNIGRITPAGVITEFSIPTANNNPGDIISGPDGNLWFTEESKIARTTPAGVIREFETTEGDLGPIVTGPDGNLWFVEQDSNHIGRISPTGILTEFSIPRACISFEFAADPLVLVTGPDGNVWFTECSHIGRITTMGSITQFSISDGFPPDDIIVGPDGNLWFTRPLAFSTDQGIGKITPSGVITWYAFPSIACNQIVSGPDGNLWCTGGNGIGDSIGGMLARITPAGVITQYTPAATAITVGPDGNLWFIDDSSNNIGRITPAGVITEFSIPTANNKPGHIIGGPDGNVWFTESDRIGRVDLSGPTSPCAGDCDASGSVTVNEIITLVNIALGNAEVAGCAAGDANQDDQITIDEILTAVNNALGGCG
jgi:streptogramin lyase